MNTSAVKGAGLGASLCFAAVGTIFLVSPDAVLRLMNGLGRGFGLAEAPLAGAGFYLALAAGYMAVVTILGCRIFRCPADPAYPLLLAQAKGASALFSLGLFAFHAPQFVFLANGLVDGALALGAYALYRSVRKRALEASRCDCDCG
jgi:hypothetical protein